MKHSLHHLASGILLPVFVFLSFYAAATTHDISVADYEYTPSTANVVVGDVVRWNFAGGSHTTTSVSVPVGAATWSSIITINNYTYSYTVTVPGTYTYQCGVHGSGMAGSFTASPATDVAVVKAPSLSLAMYPSPVKENLMVSFNLDRAEGGSFLIYNLLGEISKQVWIEGKQGRNTVSIPLGELERGVYIAELYISDRQAGIQRITKN